MIIATVSGNLVAAPKVVFKNAQGEVYGIRFGSSTYKKNGNQFEKHTIWCSGLVPKKKMETILDRLDKGTYVVAHSADATIREYQTNDGTYRSEMDLRFCQVLEAGNLKPAQTHQQGQYAQHQGVPQQKAAPSYQQAPNTNTGVEHLPF